MAMAFTRNHVPLLGILNTALIVYTLYGLAVFYENLNGLSRQPNRQIFTFFTD